MDQKKGTLAILVAMAVFGLLQARGGLFGTSKKVSSEAFLSEVASRINKDLPRSVDADTSIESVDGLEAMLVYNYRLVKVSAAELNLDQFVSEMTPNVTNAACNSSDTRDTFLKEGVTLRYAYVDKSGVPVASIDVTPAHCGL